MYTELKTGDDMKRLNTKQILVLPIGKYTDVNGLYLSKIVWLLCYKYLFCTNDNLEY